MADKTKAPQGADAPVDAVAVEGAVAPEPYGAKGAKKAKEPMSVSRRSLLIGVGSTAALLGLQVFIDVAGCQECAPGGSSVIGNLNDITGQIVYRGEVQWPGIHAHDIRIQLI